MSAFRHDSSCFLWQASLLHPSLLKGVAIEPSQSTRLQADHCPGQRTGTAPIDTCQKPLTSAGFQKSKLCFLDPLGSRPVGCVHNFTTLSKVYTVIKAPSLQVYVKGFYSSGQRDGYQQAAGRGDNYTLSSSM